MANYGIEVLVRDAISFSVGIIINIERGLGKVVVALIGAKIWGRYELRPIRRGARITGQYQLNRCPCLSTNHLEILKYGKGGRGPGSSAVQIFKRF